MQLGKYEVIKELGRGGFGIVYQAKDLTLERMVALKVLHPQLTIDMRFTHTFQREARNLAQIDHPYVVTIFEIGEIDGRIYIAMRYLPGGSLADRLKANGPIPQEEAIKVASQVAKGLQAGHKHAIIHRDVKPSNILFDDDGQAVIADFGVARAVELSTMGSSSESGGAIGTPHYRPPELWRGSPPPSAASDVYSLACVFYEMLTGQVLFSGDTPDRVLTRHVLEGVVNLIEQAGEVVPKPMVRVLEKALAKDQKDRYQSVTEFTEQLSNAVDILPDRYIKPPVIEKKKLALVELLQKIASAWAKVLEKIKAGSKGILSAKPWGKFVLPGIATLMVFVLIIGVLANNQVSNEELPNQQSLTQVSLPTVNLNGMRTSVPTAAKTESPTQVSTDTFSSSPEPRIGEALFREKDGMEQVYVPSGSFMMGSFDGDAHEQPAHEVYLDGYWIDKFEVTNAQYEKCVNEGKCEAPFKNATFTRASYYDMAIYADYPVVYVSWAKAKAYCEWVGGRLPTEAEWEKAARGTKDERNYPWGEGVDHTLANYNTNDITNVGRYPGGVSPYGVMDMAGNVWEWVSDWFNPNYYGSQAEWRNPTGPEVGGVHVVRGGSWLDSADSLRVWHRISGNMDDTFKYYEGYGFRCVRGNMPPDNTQVGIEKQSATPTPVTAENANTTPWNVETRIRAKDGMEQVLVAAGGFTMGSNNGESDEKPIHSVYLDAYWIDKFEVTNDQYARCVSAEVCSLPSDSSSFTRNAYYGVLTYANYPVIHVDWNQAKQYCEWTGGRLPTEAEWEKAARGGEDSRTYPWGNEIGVIAANYCDKNCPFQGNDPTINDGYADTAPIGKFPAGASPYGVMDLAGNVYEWVADWYDGAYYSSEKSWRNPVGPETGEYKVIRGGAWVKDFRSLRVTFRQNQLQDQSYYSIGFRCANGQN